MKKTISVIFFILNSYFVISQVAKINPHNPIWGDSVKTSYNSRDTNATLIGNEDIFARISLSFQDGNSKTISLKLNNNKKKYSNSLVLPKGVSFISIVFHTLTHQDKKNKISAKVYQDNKPVKNAFIDELPYFSTNSDSLFRLELKNYPGNYQAYGIYFSKIIPPPYSDELDNALKEYVPILEKLYKRKKNNDNLDLIFSLCIAYSKQKDIDKAKIFLIKLLKQYPESPLTNSAFGIYNYESYKAGRGQLGSDKEIVGELAKVLIGNPEALVCSENIHFLKNDSVLDIELFEESLTFAINKDSLDYSKKIELAETYLKHENYNKAEELILQSINYLLKSGMQYSWTTGNSYPQYQLAKSYNLLSKIQKEKGDYVFALASINTAISLIKGNQFESSYLSDFQKLKALIYLKLNNLNFAEEEYAILYIQEDSVSKLALLDIYKTKYQDTIGFQAHLNKLEKRYGYKVAYKKAPNFNITDRDGMQYSLNKMRGKVIVLNFWGVGCGPCVVEIPDLNKLVAKYKGNKNLIFLAITSDGDESLNNFFAKKKFDYKIVNTAKGLARKYRVSGIPQHFVINQNGKIIKHLIGAKPDIVDVISTSIDKALNN